MTQEKEKFLIVRLPNDLHRRLKMKAASKGKTIRDVVIEMLKKYE